MPADHEPLSLGVKAKGTQPAASAAATPVILQQQQTATHPTIAQPKKAPNAGAKKVAATTNNTGTSSSSKLRAKAAASSSAAAGGADSEDDEGGEDLIPHKVPMSDSDGDDDPIQAQLSPTKSASGAREKTFLSEVDLAELQPASVETAPSAAASSSSNPQGSRAAAEAALAAAESALTMKPRSEWSTESSDHTSTEVFCLTWSPDSRFLAAGCGDGSIRVFNAQTGKIAYLLRSAATMALGGGVGGSDRGVDESLPITCIRFRPSSESSSKTKNVLIAACADGTITHWHMMSQTCLYSISEQQDTPDAQVYACDYRQDGEQFATGGRDGKVRLYDESTKALTATMAAGRDKGTTGHSNRVYVVKYHPKDQNLLVSGGWDNTIQVWDCRAGYSIRSIYGPHLCGDSLDISPDGHTILTGSWRPNDTLQRWDFATGKLLDTIPFASGPGGLGADRPELLYAAAWSPDGEKFAAGGCGTNEAKIFANDEAKSASDSGPKKTSPRVIERISATPGGVYCIAFAPSGKKFALGGGGPGVTVVDV